MTIEPANPPDQPPDITPKIEAKISPEILRELQANNQSKYADLERDLKYKHQWFVWLCAVVLAVTSTLLAQSSWGILIRERFEAPLDYAARRLLGRDIPLDKKIKIIMFDDSSFARLQKPELDYREWATLLERLAAKSPKAIYIDKIFGSFFDQEIHPQEFVSRIKRLASPVFVGSFVHGAILPGREPMSRDDLALGTPQLGDSIKFNEVDALDMKQQHVYGPDSRIKNAFHVGHILYLGERYWAPLTRVEDNHFLRAMPVGNKEIIVLDKGTLRINGHEVQTRNGKTPINYLDPALIYQRAKPIHLFLGEPAQQNIDRYFAKDDEIFIVPLAFTGNTDFKNSPRGKLIGGILPISELNSLLIGAFIRESNSLDYFASLLCSLTGVATLFLGPIVSWIWLITAAAGSIGGGIAFFVFGNLSTPWSIYTATHLAVGLVAIASKAQLERRKGILLRQMQTTVRAMAAEQALVKAEQKVLLQEKREASLIASAFQPTIPPPIWGSLETSVFHHCFDAASGDWFFLDQSSNGNLRHAVLCDITGHGVQAALVVSTCRTVLSMIQMEQRHLLERTDFLLEFAKILNHILVKQGAGRHCCTLAGVTFDSAAQSCYYITCGHPPPILQRLGSAGKITSKRLLSRGSVVGFAEPLEVALQLEPFLPGNSLALYSDGCSLNLKGKFFDKFTQELDDWDESATRLYHAYWEQRRRAEGEEPDDDATILLFRHLASPNIK
jgi:serine phosphatase RsbU (regulator of sigma subunit)